MAAPSPITYRPEAIAQPHEAFVPVRPAVLKPGIAATLIVCGDLLAVTTALGIAVLARHAAGGDYLLSLYASLWPILVLFPAGYALFGLYPGVTFNVVTEIRRATAATTAVFLILAVLTFLLRVADVYSRLVFLMAWMIALPAVPLTRALIRLVFAGKSWWGYPLVVFGAGPAAREMIRALRQQPQLGLRAVAVLDPRQPEGTLIEGLRVIHRAEYAPVPARSLGILRCVITVPGMSRDELAWILHSHVMHLPHLLIVLDLDGISSLQVEARDFCRLLTLETRNSLLLRWPCFFKRLIDIGCTLALAIPLLPLAALIALLIKLESRGPVLYGHPRLGHDGRRFTVWKFRTMVINADQVLKQHLRHHAEAAAEWTRHHKIKDDPRITRFGQLLRRTSLDELPQLWNVVRGDMSLVGPRPIVAEEVEKYHDAYQLYTRVRPGMTGLWQVSGRNDTSYDERVRLDTYYVRNWSPWLDIYLLARTVNAVLARSGAY